ncbi:hypothetical protein GCM10009792_20120 [Microcella alkalica]|uniref:Uncharacterized protein n=1 Tax=Microcella alkalica TaxID=355930 RepID=A0A839E6D9_9MICO|nr:hypothetical protein [Microcella alkalica]MBA8847360.1 hypothetical protein [Microcella alkalica]
MLHVESQNHPKDSQGRLACWELASRTLQATGAIYLLAMASRNPDLPEIHLAIDRVHDWLQELEDSALSSDLETRTELTPVVSSLSRVTRHLRQLLEPGATGLLPAAPLLVNDLAAAASVLRHARGNRDARTEFISACCAANVRQISQTREKE